MKWKTKVIIRIRGRGCRHAVRMNISYPFAKRHSLDQNCVRKQKMVQQVPHSGSVNNEGAVAVTVTENAFVLLCVVCTPRVIPRAQSRILTSPRVPCNKDRVTSSHMHHASTTMDIYLCIDLLNILYSFPSSLQYSTVLLLSISDATTHSPSHNILTQLYNHHQLPTTLPTLWSRGRRETMGTPLIFVRRHRKDE